MVYAKGYGHRHYFTRKWFKQYAKNKNLKHKVIVRIDGERDVFKYILPLEILVWLWKPSE